MKQLLVVILRDDACKTDVLKVLNNSELHGAVIPTTSIRRNLLQSDVEPLPMFGGMRQVIDKPHDLNTTILVLVEEEKLAGTISAVKKACAEKNENPGYLFAVPVCYYEENLI